MEASADGRRRIIRWGGVGAFGRVAVCGAACFFLLGASEGPRSSDTVLGFVVTRFSPAIYPGKDDCPEGLALNIREAYLATQTPAERERLQKPENAVEFEKKYKGDFVLGPNDTNICSNYELFDRPPQRTVQGKISYGMDLDGDDGKGGGDVCEHESFAGPAGQLGIDNQLYRAQGCHPFYRGTPENEDGGPLVGAPNRDLASGDHTMVMLLKGVDDRLNDPEVELIFATTGDAPIVDSNLAIVENASFTVSENPRWRNVARAKIVDGVLTSEPVDLRLTKRAGVGGTDGYEAEYDLRRARFRLTFNADGSVEGMVGAYQPVVNVMTFFRHGGLGVATVAGNECASIYKTLQVLADGVRDPATGRCTAVSMANKVRAIPAFVFDRQPDGRVAKAQVSGR